jgi:hypothetical protein
MDFRDGVRNIIYDSFKVFINYIFREYDITISGLENIINSNKGGIIVSNHAEPKKNWTFRRDKSGKPIYSHTHSVDHLLIGSFLRNDQRIHALVGMRHYKNPFSTFLLNCLQQIPANRNGFIKKCKEYIDKKEYILIFPEGLTQTIKLNIGPEKIHPGLGILVRYLDNPEIFPVNISIKGKKDELWPDFESARLIFDKSFNYLNEFGSFPVDKTGKIDYIRISQEIMEEKVYPLGV